MTITENVSIVKKKATGLYELAIRGKVVDLTEEEESAVAQLYNYALREKFLDKVIEFSKSLNPLPEELVKELGGIAPEDCSKEGLLEKTLNSLIDFFREFSFEPNFRFINTMAQKSSAKDKKDYIYNYFALMDNAYLNEITEKMKSKEFNAILKELSIKPKNIINNRFKIYYGSAGTGKTTKAIKETENRCVVCNASMLPADLMEDFVFVDGKPSFKPSKLWECMEEGKTITLDEINLLPFDSLRFLQGILDGKTEFNYKGKAVHINKGFKIIGTMNLAIGGMVYGLPEPLVDRAESITSFKLSAKDLMSAFD